MKLSFRMPDADAPNAFQATPFALFAICLAFLGLGLCWRLAPYPDGIGHLFGEAILGVGYIFTGAAFLCQALRLLWFPRTVLDELDDPIRGPIALQMVIALQLIAESLTEVLPELAEVLVLVTSCVALLASPLMLTVWRRHPGYYQLQTPTWLIPGISIGIASFLCGIHSWMTSSKFLLALTILWFAAHAVGSLSRDQRLPVPDPARPLFLIFHAPVPILYLSWLQAQGDGVIAMALLSVASAISVFLCVWSVHKLRAPFGYPWWAAGMPPMVLVLALFAPRSEGSDIWLFAAVALVAFIGVHLAFLCLFLATIWAALRRKMLPLPFITRSYF